MTRDAYPADPKQPVACYPGADCPRNIDNRRFKTGENSFGHNRQAIHHSYGRPRSQSQVADFTQSNQEYRPGDCPGHRGADRVGHDGR